MKAVKRPKEPFEFILPEDRELPTEEQTVFVCQPLTQEEEMVVLDGLSYETRNVETGERTVHSRSWRQALEIAQSHIEEVRNFPAGNPQPWPSGASARAEYLKMLSEEQVFRIGDAIRNHALNAQLEQTSTK